MWDYREREKRYKVANREKILAYGKRYRDANGEKRKAYEKLYRETHREKIAGYRKLYREGNSEKIAAYNKAYREAHKKDYDPEKIKEYKRKYYVEHRSEILAKSHERYVHVSGPRKRLAQHDHHLKHRYKITREDYNRMLKDQNGVCAICHKTCRKNERLSVDHCHATEVVRGLLCSRCNHVIGLMEDSLENLTSAASYIRKHSQLRFPAISGQRGLVCSAPSLSV
jgi:hypothetical protein